VNSFTHVAGILKDRFKKPVGQISFWSYLIVAVLGMGGLGIWHAIREAAIGVQPLEAVSISIYTYFAALAGASIFQLILNDDKAVRATFMLLGSGLAVYAGFCFFFLDHNSDIALWAGGLGFVISLLIWWAANGDNSCLYDNIDPTASLGGDDTAQPVGSDEGFEV